MTEDVKGVFAFFGQYGDAFEVVKQKWRAVELFEGLLSAPKGQPVVEAYARLKEVYWDVQMGWIEAVLRSRDDFERAMLAGVKARAAEMSGERGAETVMTIPISLHTTMLASRVAARSARVAAPRLAQTPLCVRGFADAKAGTDTKPPIALFGLDGTYASALYTAAAKSSALDPVSKAMDSLAATFKRDPKLHSILTAPTLSVSDKKQIVAELHKSTGVTDKSKTLDNFLDTLAENNRLNVLDGVAEKFGLLMSASRGEVELTITSAAP
ncbi:ATP synthase F0 subcomplex subunit OSCP atp5, partial [Oleoguttula sp. CCFEE 5521]